MIQILKVLAMTTAVALCFNGFYLAGKYDGEKSIKLKSADGKPVIQSCSINKE